MRSARGGESMLKERPWKTVRPPVSMLLVGIGGGTDIIIRRVSTEPFHIRWGDGSCESYPTRISPASGKWRTSVQTSMIRHDLQACPDLVWIRGADPRLGTLSALQSGPGGAWYSNETRFRPTRRDQQGDYPQGQAHVHPSISYCVNPNMR